MANSRKGVSSIDGDWKVARDGGWVSLELRPGASSRWWSFGDEMRSGSGVTPTFYENKILCK
jgi:hypothetical protein